MKSKAMLFAVALATVVPMVAGAAVIARIGSTAISDEQVKSEYQTATKDQRKTINEDENTRRQLIESLINTELLVLAAKKAGLDKDSDYKAALERFNRQYLATRFVQKLIEPKLTKGETQKFFEQNKGYFDSTQVCAHHIVVQDPKEAEKIVGDAKANPATFETLATKSSVDPTVQDNKGNLGCFTREKMVPEFSAAAFNMRKGDIGGPVRTAYGYHVIKIDDIKAGTIPGFEEVEQRVKETYRMKLMSDLVKDLRQKSGVIVDEAQVKKFRL